MCSSSNLVTLAEEQENEASVGNFYEAGSANVVALGLGVVASTALALLASFLAVRSRAGGSRGSPGPSGPAEELAFLEEATERST